MIIDLPRFLASEQPHWAALERMLDRLEADPHLVLTLEQVQQFHYLYERAAADLAKLATFSSEPETRRYLESLVARAYGEIHESRRKFTWRGPWRWLCQALPQTFRRHLAAFWMSLGITLAGVCFGAAALALDPDAKAVIMPFGHLLGDPARRVAEEEGTTGDGLRGAKSRFSAMLMTHNTRVSIFAMALGMTWGVGTIILLFYNGVILGAVVLDYVRAGQTTFLAGWLLPHGAVEIPAILIAGQAGLVLAGALIGWGRRTALRERMRAVSRDLVTLIGGVALMLVWAGIIEAFLSQYHEPVIPYSAKILFGVVELGLLVLFYGRAGRNLERESVARAARQPGGGGRAASNAGA